jgi:hypothetical protein
LIVLLLSSFLHLLPLFRPKKAARAVGILPVPTGDREIATPVKMIV